MMCVMSNEADFQVFCLFLNLTEWISCCFHLTMTYAVDWALLTSNCRFYPSRKIWSVSEELSACRRLVKLVLQGILTSCHLRRATSGWITRSKLVHPNLIHKTSSHKPKDGWQLSTDVCNFPLLARIFGECSTIYSLPALFNFYLFIYLFFKWRLARAH